MDDDFEIDYNGPCSNCGNEVTHWRHCIAGCDEGSFDLHDEDPINYMPGEEYELCEDCGATGIEHWCPRCGTNFNRLRDSDGS